MREGEAGVAWNLGHEYRRGRGDKWKCRGDIRKRKGSKLEGKSQ